MIDTIYPSVHGIFSWNDEGLVRKMDILCSLSILLYPLEKQRITISIDIINRLPFPFHARDSKIRFIRFALIPSRIRYSNDIFKSLLILEPA